MGIGRGRPVPIGPKLDEIPERVYTLCSGSESVGTKRHKGEREMPRKKNTENQAPTGVTVERVKARNIHLDDEDGKRLMTVNVDADLSITFLPKVSGFTLNEKQLRAVRSAISQSINAQKVTAETAETSA
jgi:hypothetical protein